MTSRCRPSTRIQAPTRPTTPNGTYFRQAPTIYQELVDAINGLNDPERIELLALTWLGRGDYAKEEWRDAVEEARRIHDEKETQYLVGTPLLADYLEEGLSQLGYSLEDCEIGRM